MSGKLGVAQFDDKFYIGSFKIKVELPDNDVVFKYAAQVDGYTAQWLTSGMETSFGNIRWIAMAVVRKDNPEQNDNRYIVSYQIRNIDGIEVGNKDQGKAGNIPGFYYNGIKVIIQRLPD